MGGAREKQLSGSQSAQTGKISKTLGKGNRIRIHEKDGQVHFHDDNAGLKVAIPCNLYEELWNSFNPARKNASISFCDVKRQTIVLIETIPPKFQSGQITMDVSVRVEKARLGNNIKQLLEFVDGNNER